MFIAMLGNGGWAIVAAIAAPIAFALTFLLFTKDPGTSRGAKPGHPAYWGDDIDDDEGRA